MRYPGAFGSSLASILREPCSRSLAPKSSSLPGGCAPLRDAQPPGVCVRINPAGVCLLTEPYGNCQGQLLLLKLPNPDIPEADGLALVAMRLEFDRSSRVGLVERLADVQRLALQLEVILHQDAVEKHRGIGRSLQRAVAIERRRRPHHVVCLPLSRLAGRIGQWYRLLVEAARHAVHVRLVLVRIEYLQLISVVARPSGSKKHTAVASSLTSAGDVCGNFPLEVKLVVLEAPLGLDVS